MTMPVVVFAMLQSEHLQILFVSGILGYGGVQTAAVLSCTLVTTARSKCSLLSQSRAISCIKTSLMSKKTT